ncbi:MAG TPA: ankyrin repeat domain-containing protein [Methylomirabilota bacterium]|nr:ankyrin repeat domain-containing protein [Methylomirabilota bacterium]
MSKTRLAQSIKALDLPAVKGLLEADPRLREVRDERGRNALHLLCAQPSTGKTVSRSLKLAEYLLDAGFDVNHPAFVEGTAFKATPLWFSLSRGRNIALARLLLKRGSSPEYCLWTAAFSDDPEAIDLLVKSGASIDPVTEDETPFLGAIKWSRFTAAERLLHHGANVNFQDSKGTTALHLVLKKNSDRKHVLMLVRHGADPTIRDKRGVSPLDMVAKRRDKTYFELFSEHRSA